MVAVSPVVVIVEAKEQVEGLPTKCDHLLERRRKEVACKTKTPNHQKRNDVKRVKDLTIHRIVIP
jgi:hypothetical protein